MLELLIIREGCSRYGILLGQVASISQADKRAAATLTQLLAGVKATGKVEKMLRIKGVERLPVLIGEPEEICSVPLHEVRALPKVMRRVAGTFGIWALVWQKEGALLLLDFYKNSIFKKLADGLTVGKEQVEEGGKDEKRS